MTKESFEIDSIHEFFPISSRVSDYFDSGGKKLYITIEQKQDKRSNKQNKYYWSVVIPKCLEFYKANPTEFIGDILNAVRASITRDFVHYMCKITFLRNSSTRKLDTVGMEEYMENIREHMRACGVDIPPPNEPELEDLK